VYLMTRKSKTVTVSPRVVVNPPKSNPIPAPVSTLTKYNASSMVPYFMVLYPVVDKPVWFKMDPKKIRKLYQSLNWYYLPVVDDVGTQMVTWEGHSRQISRRAPLAGAYKNQWTEAFLSDSTDQLIWLEPVNQDNAKIPCDGVQEDDKCTKNCCFYGSTCTGKEFDGMCRDNAATAACSVFPSKAPPNLPAQGPTWHMGAHACSLDDLSGNKVSTACQNKLSAIGSDGKSLLKNETIEVKVKNKKGKYVNEKVPVNSADFQFITLIQPFARKQGCPNFAYIEQVAYVCEGGGKLLLTAPDCISPSLTNAEYIGSFLRNKFCGIECDPTDWKACEVSAEKWKAKQHDVVENFIPRELLDGHQFIDDEDAYHRPQHHAPTRHRPTKPTQPTHPAKPTGPPLGTLKGTAMGPGGCGFKDGWNAFNQTGANGRGLWVGPHGQPASTLQDIMKGHAVVSGKPPASFPLAATYGVNLCSQHPDYPANSPKCSGHTMFYWEAGYGKFLNMGISGVYQNYIHFLLTLPNNPVTLPNNGGKANLRMTLPGVLSMGVASSSLSSLQALCGEGKEAGARDKRRYLSGYVTTFQKGSVLGRKYGLVPNDVSNRRHVGYVYDFEASDDDWENKVVVISGRSYWATHWDPHIETIPSKQYGNVFPTSVNTWNKEYNKKIYNNNIPGIGNAGGLQNPQEGITAFMQYLKQSRDRDAYLKAPPKFQGDANLCAIASQCVQCYYPPNLNIENPHYNEKVAMSSDDGCLLWQAININGDTGCDTYGYSNGPAKCKELLGAGCLEFPYSSYYFGAGIGSCIYALTAALGWNSSQFALMPTGGGNAKFCTYPGYDFEIVQIADKKALCSNLPPGASPGERADYDTQIPYAFKLLDITGGGNEDVLDFYTQHGFIQGSTIGGTNSAAHQQARLEADKAMYKVQPFNACLMPLSEQNVDPTVWGNKTPNMLFYDEPHGKCELDPSNYSEDITDYENCIKKGTPDGWVYSKNGKIITGRDCPYADKPGSVRTQAEKAGVAGDFAPNWMKPATHGHRRR